MSRLWQEVRAADDIGRCYLSYQGQQLFMIPQPKCISDQKVLDWILSGELIVTDFDKRQPTLTFRGRVLKPSWHYCNGRRRLPGNKRPCWRLSDGCVDGKRRRRTIAVNKLVYMAYHRRLIHAGCVVHHGPDEDRWNNAITNLSELDEHDHRIHHYQKEF